MMFRRGLLTILSTLIVIGGAAPALAQDVETAKKKVLSKRAAEADAYRKLAETVKGLHINSKTLVQDFVAKDDAIQAGMDEMIKGVRLGEPRWFEDLSCEVPAEVSVVRVIDTLKELHAKHYHDDDVKGADFEQMRQDIRKDVIQVVGMGAPRPDLPPDLPAGVEQVITQVPDLPEAPIPDLWIKMGVQARLMAVRAAELDAKRRLLERIKGVRINSTTMVKDFVTEWDQIQSEADGLVVGVHPIRTYYHLDEPIVEVTCQVPVESVITMIKELHTRHYRGDDVDAKDITKTTEQLKSQTFEATGMGIPPQKYIQQIAASVPVPIPDWAGGRIAATGAGTDDAIATPQGKLRAARAAELDAKRKLAEQTLGLRVSSDSLVSDFLSKYDEVRAQADAVVGGALIEKTEWKGDTAEVTVSIPGMELWNVISQQMTILKRRG